MRECLLRKIKVIKLQIIRDNYINIFFRKNVLTKTISLSYFFSVIIFFIIINFTFINTSTGTSSINLRFNKLDLSKSPFLSVDFYALEDNERPLSGLSRNEVKLFLDGKKIRNFTILPLKTQDESNDIVFVLQNTLSMKGDNYYWSKFVVKSIVERLATEDRIALISFSDKTQILLDLSNEKFRLNRMLQKTSLRKGSLSIYEAILFAALSWENQIKKDLTLIVLFNQPLFADTQQKQNLKEILSSRKIKLIAVNFNNSKNYSGLQSFIDSCEGSYKVFRKKSDIWSLFKLIDSKSNGLYRLLIPKVISNDFASHSLKLVIEMFGLNASVACHFIGAPDEGVNPHTYSTYQLFSENWSSFFFASAGAFSLVLLLFISEKLFHFFHFHRLAYLLALIIGAIAGLLLIELITSLPN